MRYKLGIDLGTSYFKFGIYDKNLNLNGLGRVPFIKDVGDGSLCVLPPQKFTDLLQTGVNLACKEAGIRPSQIDAIGYSSQANSFILLDGSSTPLTHSKN